MKQTVRILIGIAMTTALALGFTATAPGAAPAAQAAPGVSATYTAPQKGETSAGVMALQRRLIKAGALGSSYATGYFGSLTESAVKRFQRANGRTATGRVTRSTWSLLVKKTGSIPVASASSSRGSSRIDRRCKTSGRVLCIDKTRDKLYYMNNSRVIRTMDARFGCASTRTREGRFRVFRKSRHHVSSIYQTPMPYAMFFSGGQAVHYSADFARRGYNGCSHGCVNIRNKSAISYVYSRIRIGDRVVVYRS